MCVIVRTWYLVYDAVKAPKPVFDESSNRIQFLGTAYVKMELADGNSSIVAPHISPSKQKEPILGTNVLFSLGVSVSISWEVGNGSEVCRSKGSQAQVCS